MIQSLLDLRGPDFLGVYLTLMVAVALLAALLLWMLRPDGEPQPKQLDLDAYSVAYLARGERGVIEAALAALLHKGALKLDPTDGAIETGGPLERKAAPIERELHQACAAGPTSAVSLARDAKGLCGEIQQRLFRLGLLLGFDEKLWAKLIAAIPIVLLGVLGLAKIGVGISRDRPVGFLMVLTLVVFGGLLAELLYPVERNRVGDRVLALLRTRHEGLRDEVSHRQRVDDLSPDELVVGVSLFGFALLASTPLEPLQFALYPSRSGVGSGSSDGCGSGCGGGGCGGGCGGGGCGGCGS